MHILADENIALARQYFGPYGRLTLTGGRRISRELLHDVDALLVRSVTRVDAALLDGTPCRYVATATSGIDHIDTDYLARNDIAFGWARGCNAEGVVDYFFSACAALHLMRRIDWLDRGVGIVGCGEIGSRLARRLLALGVTPRIHDPLLDPAHPLTACLAPLHEVLGKGVVTLHVPLTTGGAAPTVHMIDAAALARMPRDGVLVNAARGGVVDEAALVAHCRHHEQFSAVIDAWRGEPGIDGSLAKAVTLGTAHIAGYSHGGKLRGTRMVHAHFCRHFGLDPALAPRDGDLVPARVSCPPGDSPRDRLSLAILAAYDVRGDAGALGRSLDDPAPGHAFDALRRDYGLRREFSEYRVTGVGEADHLRHSLEAVGLRVD